MAIIAISGPSASGKTELFDALRDQLGDSGIVFLPDVFKTVWVDLVSKGLLMEEEDINKDSEILCCFIQRVIDKYKEYIDTYKDSDKTVIIDGCWVDLSIYSTLNMWYKHTIKEIQSDLFSQISSYDKNIVRIYITQFDDTKNVVARYCSRFKRYNLKFNRPLEIQYYELASNFRNATNLPTSELYEATEYIIGDLTELGYL